MSDDNIVSLDIEGHIATVSINRPERRNALSIEAANRLHDIWEEIDANSDIRVAILTSAQCGTFCAGMDLKQAAQIKAEKGVDILSLIRDPFHQRMRRVNVPIIAAMTGHFAAGGFMLMLNSDIRVGLADTSGGVTEVKRGRGSPWAVPVLWQLPQPFVMELLLTGDSVPVERFRELGFVNHVENSPEQVMERARAIAANIASNAPLSVKAAKLSTVRALSLGCEAGLEEANAIYETVYASEDAQEGPRAFSEKREPVWQGR
ncbi:enoyl-CoA hydratase/isomerase family protein [Sulfitobacter dubius]|uniref:Carnitinyl-CoA dehydratase n=1 Tax=Sulfitobacter dubius TaxID=218673 RepID=A0ABY3ZU08_9RHOB|nr:enoyl-CoA hydratase-related protein [Sulfitobacter dubius]UOA17204.1 Carnitinyl-CoA dehydratase [Sulfitobacter dubius]